MTTLTTTRSGPGCRNWRTSRYCQGMFGLPAVRVQSDPQVLNKCHDLAAKEKRCYTNPEGGNIIILPRTMRGGEMVSCFCSRTACLSSPEIRSSSNFNSHLCGPGTPMTTTCTTTTTTTTTTGTTTTTTPYVIFDGTVPSDVPGLPETCSLKDGNA